MKSFFRCMYILVAPLAALAITLVACARLMPFIYHNAVQDRVFNAVQTHLQEHPDVPVALFHDNIFVSTKEIAKGQKLEVDSLERSDYAGTDEDPSKVARYDDLQVVGAIADNNIHKGQLISAEDLREGVSVKDPVEADKAVKDSDLNSVVSIAFITIYALAIIAMIASFLAGYIWVTVSAFKKSLLWGLSCLMLPLAATIFEVKHWQQMKKPFHLKVLSFALLGICFGALIFFRVQASQLENLLATTATILYCIRDVKEGTVIKADDIDERLLSVSKVPQDAITTKAEAVGHKAKYGISSGMIISTHDVSK